MPIAFVLLADADFRKNLRWYVAARSARDQHRDALFRRNLLLRIRVALFAAEWNAAGAAENQRKQRAAA